MKLVVKKHNNSLVGATAKSQDKINRFRAGGTYEIDIRRIRSYATHKFYFGVLGLFYQNYDFEQQPPFENWRKNIEFTAGHTELVTNYLTGEVKLLPKSVDYAKLGEDEFKEVLDSVFDVLSKLNPDLLEACKKNFEHEEI